MAALPRQVAHAQRTTPAPSAASCRRSTPAPSTRAPRWRGCRSRASTNCSSGSRRARRRSVRRLLRHCAAPRMRARVRVARARSTNPKARRATTGAAARALFAAGFRAGDLVHNSLQLPHDAGRLHHGDRARIAVGCTVFPAGVGQTEQQLQAIAELQARRLHRHAELPAHPGRKGRRDRHRHLRACARRWSAARRCPPQPARLVRASTASTATRAMPRPTWA